MVLETVDNRRTSPGSVSGITANVSGGGSMRFFSFLSRHRDPSVNIDFGTSPITAETMNELAKICDITAQALRAQAGEE